MARIRVKWEKIRSPKNGKKIPERKMIAKEYESVLKEHLNMAQFLLLTLLVGCLQQIRDMRLERLAEALPLTILMESRRKKIQRFLNLEILSIEKIWFPCVKEFVKETDKYRKGGCVYLAIDRTNWGLINILTVSLIYDKRAVLVYWEFLESKGSSNLTVQKRVIEKAISLFSEYKIVILGDREFCSVTRLKMARGERSVFLFKTEKDNKCIRR